jgi:hypothetical protein
MELNNDGSVKGQTFSGPGYTGEYPSVKSGETYRRYRERVDKLRPLGFHLGDLSWGDWDSYCKGSGSYEGVDADDFIED